MESIELVYRDGTTETFDSVSMIEAGQPELFRRPGMRCDYAMPETTEQFPRVLYLTERAGDTQPRFIRDIREIRAYREEGYVETVHSLVSEGAIA